MNFSTLNSARFTQLRRLNRSYRIASHSRPEHMPQPTRRERIAKRRAEGRQPETPQALFRRMRRGAIMRAFYAVMGFR